MATRAEGSDGIEVVRPGRSLTAGTVEGFQRTVRDARERGRRHVLVDLGDTEAVDSSGVGALVRLQREAEDAGGRLALVSPRENTRILLRLSQLDEVLEAYDSRGEAEAAWGRGERPSGGG